MKGEIHCAELKGNAVNNQQYLFNVMKDFLIKLLNVEILKVLCKEK